MRNLLLISIILISTMSATFVAAQGHSKFSEYMVKMFSEKHQMSEYQQALSVELFSSFMSLAQEVKKPKKQVKHYISGLVQADSVDVDLVLQEYRAWQRNIDEKFEVALRHFAELHQSLSIEQREQLVQTIKDMQKKD